MGDRWHARAATWSRAIPGRLPRIVIAALLATTVPMVSFAEPAGAVHSTGGGARFPAIEWVSWGADGANVPNNTSRTETFTIAGKSVSVTCTITSLAGTVSAYRSGDWQGDGFDNLYNIGGPDGANTMVAGLAVPDNSTSTFNFSCSATLGGASFPLSGLVMADAEASGGTEYVGATIPDSRDVAHHRPRAWPELHARRVRPAHQHGGEPTRALRPGDEHLRER